jgi:ElaB/YqjD/DUF883 family membrane-anchored ribosome-binding protein
MTDSQLERQLEQLRDDLARLRGDVGALADALSGGSRAAADDLAGRARERLRTAAENLAGCCSSEMLSQVEEQVRRHPLVALAAAFSLGCCLGKLFGRRSSR